MNFLTLARSALDLVYPRQCRVCHTGEGCDRFPFLCDDCFDGAPRLEPPCCEICSLPVPGRVDVPFDCPNCREGHMHFERAFAVMRFRGAVRHAIHELKYNRHVYWARPLLAWLTTGVDRKLARGEIDCITCVPLYPVRERERGFNQAWLLGEALGRHWQVPTVRGVLVRRRDTETQTHLNRTERIANMKNAFALGRDGVVKGKRILLVDDVLTTGSTTSECARILLKGGAASVLVFTLARG